MVSSEREVAIRKRWEADSKNKVCRTNVILKFNHLYEKQSQTKPCALLNTGFEHISQSP